ncbi:hypothetical protein L218DRAFT_883445 [Marasmius fiardii PR-910]|nr:hypothetical protein L218DRAFT_883445 [Marasmius fiardii PR-910]
MGLPADPLVKLTTSSLSLPTLLAIVVPIYLVTVQYLRWRRFNAMHTKFLPKVASGHWRMTPEEAQEIMQVSWRYDMPQLLGFSFAFALFKTYGIPTISKLLAATKQLKSPENVSKRFMDTRILITTWQACPISGKTNKGEEDPRANVSIARVNWLHSKYNIKNEDHLYTLAASTFEPIRFAKKFGWRELSPLECEAYFVFWKEVGRRMGIKDIPATAEEFECWEKDYENQHMIPAQTNQEVAFHTAEELVRDLPEAFGIKEMGRQLLACLMDDTVRMAMMQPSPPTALRTLLFTTLRLCALFDRYIGIPRFRNGLPINPALPDLCKSEFRNGDGNGSNSTTSTFPTQHPTVFVSKPWYKPASKSLIGRFWDSVLVKLPFVGYDDVPGEKWRFEGYRLDRMGPLKYENQGMEEVIRMAEEIQGCPISSSWKGTA